MPATAGHVKMPANNRIHSSAALRTTAIWSDAIGMDPHAAEKKGGAGGAAAIPSVSQDTLALAKDLMDAAKAKASKQQNAALRGACKKCGGLGHLTFQCRNFLSMKNKDEIHSDDGKHAREDDDDDDDDEEKDEEQRYAAAYAASRRDRSPDYRYVEQHKDQSIPRPRSRSPSRKSRRRRKSSSSDDSSSSSGDSNSSSSDDSSSDEDSDDKRRRKSSKKGDYVDNEEEDAKKKKKHKKHKHHHHKHSSSSKSKHKHKHHHHHHHKK